MASVQRRAAQPGIQTFSCVPLYATVDAGAAAETAIIANTAVPTGKRVRVVGYTISGGGATGTATFNSKPAGAGAGITSSKTTIIGGIISAPYNPLGHFESNMGEGISVTMAGVSATAAIDLTYVEV